MKINKKDIMKKYVLPILIFGGIIFLATMKGSTIEKFDMESCVAKIKKSAKGKLKGCKEWDGDENEYGECNKKGQKQQDAVTKWAESQCNNKKNHKEDKKAYGSKFISWSKMQAKKYMADQKKSYRDLGPATLVQSGGRGSHYASAAAYAPLQVAFEVKF